MSNRDYRVQVCGWPVKCFDAQGNQLYTPRELEQAAQEDQSCPPGVCMPHRGEQLTGAVGLDRDFEADGRAEAQCQPQRREPARLGDGRIEVIMPVDSRSWLDVILGRK
jgi:hypothetical protein